MNILVYFICTRLIKILAEIKKLQDHKKEYMKDGELDLEEFLEYRRIRRRNTSNRGRNISNKKHATNPSEEKTLPTEEEILLNSFKNATNPDTIF